MLSSSLIFSSRASRAPHDAHGLRFLRLHLHAPLLALVFLTLLLVPLRGDLWLADHLYAWEGGRWALQQDFVAQHLIHVLGRRASLLAWCCVALLAVASLAIPRLRPWCRPLLFLLLATALSTAAVSWLKAWTGMDCPWDLQRYGGTRPYIDLFAARPAGLPRGTCFPAGHASAGYAWVALYFFFLACRRRLRWLGLGVGLAAGMAFGVAQQLRGAHFLSHDLWTLAICWTTSLLLYPRLALPLPEDHRRGRAITGPAAGFAGAAEP